MQTAEAKQFNPYTRVLARYADNRPWDAVLYGRACLEKAKGLNRAGVGMQASQVIPYKGNEHLLGTTGKLQAGSARKTKKREQETKECTPPTCGSCALCIHTHTGGECQLTDNAVEDEQDACIDYIATEED